MAGSGSTVTCPRQYRPSGSTAPKRVVVPLEAGKQQFPTTVVRSGTTVLPNSKIFLPNSNLDSLVAFSNLLKPRFSQKSRDATTIAPKTQDLKTRQKERRNRGNTGIHGKRMRWGSTPPKEMERGAPETEIRRSPPAASGGWREEEERGGRMGMGEKKSPPAPI